jgi:hypothetical protein
MEHAKQIELSRLHTRGPGEFARFPGEGVSGVTQEVRVSHPLPYMTTYTPTAPPLLERLAALGPPLDDEAMAELYPLLTAAQDALEQDPFVAFWRSGGWPPRKPHSLKATSDARNETADSAPVLDIRVAAPFPDPLLHVLDHQVEFLSRKHRRQFVHCDAAVTRETHLSLRRLAEPAIGEPGVGLHSGLRDLTLVASDAEHVLDHLLPVARLLADLADEPLGPAARIA